MCDNKGKKKAKKYCLAYGCLNNDANVQLIFSTLPTNLERCREWLALLNREDLLTKKNFIPHNYYVCSVHFEDSSFRKCLKLNSCPIKFSPNLPQKGSRHTDEQACLQNQYKIKINANTQLRKLTTVLTETQTESSKQSATASTEIKVEPLNKSEIDTKTTKHLTAQTPRKRKLSDELRNSQNKCRRLDREIAKIQKELKRKNTPITKQHPDEVAKIFHKLIEWQNKLKIKFKGNRYTAEYKLFALNLYYASPQAYRLLETILRLPSKITIHRFKINIPTKLEDRQINSLEFKMKSLPDTAKYCTICVNEMTLKRNLYYDIKRDEVIGFHNINGKITPEIASNAYTIMLQGIRIKWKQPLAYALLASTMHYEELDLWLKEVITKLFSIGIKVKAITSDQGSNFDKFAKQIKKVTVDKPYFMYGDKKIYYIFDVPHLIKCIRNNLLSSDFHYDDKKISWDFIKQLYNDQKYKNFRLIPNLTECHIDPNDIQKMRVKYAVQVFSRTVSAALHSYIDLGIISEEARPTANFLETMNNLFDVLNSSKIKCKNKYESAFRRCDYQEKVLDEAFVIFSKIKVINKKTKENNTTHMKSFINAQISIQSIKKLYEDLKKDGLLYIFTRRLNQDCLEFFSGSIRQENGSCTEPTPIQFQRAFSKLFLCHMLQNPPNSNGEADIYDILLQAEEVVNTYKISTATESAETSVLCLEGETDHRMDLPEENPILYVSGYLLYKCMDKHRCNSIIEALNSVPDLAETKIFIQYKAYNRKSGFHGALKMPPQEFIKYIQNLEDVFTHYFEKTIQGNPGVKLYELLQSVFPQVPCSCFPLNYLLKLFIRLRIYSTLRLNNRTFKDGKSGIKKLIKMEHL